MIDHYEIFDYLDSLCPGDSLIEEKLRKEAEAEKIPIIRRDTEPLLRVLLNMKRPENVLEIGTATGYSSIFMALTGYAGHIDTVEIGETDYRKALANAAYAGVTDRVSYNLEDAGRFMERLIKEGRKYDFIFMDAAKGQYLTWLPLVKRLLNEGGLLVSDNVLQDGSISDSRYTVVRRERTIHANLREYLYQLTHSDDMQTFIIPNGDGVSVTLYLGAKAEGDRTE